jgi:catechol-2,3-dioxygenase
MNAPCRFLLASLTLAWSWQPAAATVQVNEVGCIAMSVRNLQKSLQFYEEVLDFQLVN